MTLQLDARQRAMLQEMGITLWQPAPKTAPAVAEQRPVDRSAARAAAGQAAGVDAAVMERPPAAQPRQPQTQPQRPAPAHATVTTAPAQGSASSSSATANATLRAPQALYPNADAAATPKELGSGWLVVFETATPDEPFGGDSGKLLDNMLRAMRLHLHPRTHACVLERSVPGGQEINTDAVKAALAETIAELQPALVLILGLGAARATLGNREPLGRLRAAQHRLADGTPAIVSYDPAYLLRAPDAKASAWADLCHALAVVRKAADN
ncbi:uracil-DNA glycosylase family protein [Diaphorobacter caeni]|uniref:uracil-DNA glycosylase family protein n=1 Tax=Diaphorobacter caeni TaxID=2784387 RepID=UPI00188E37F8|nr:uracil-DNA glycosylase family protein [Diaphorobacter caeni]MBF5005623.1 hypothetical protein [Diaphorobacter caeni]